MRLAAVSLVRDECDIVEAFVRHNLSLLDHLYVLDNWSSDATPEILRKLIEEGLPVSIVPDEDGYFYQSRKTMQLLRHAVADQRWDFLFVLDCDEFLDAPDRAALEYAVSALDGGGVGFSNYVQYVPDERDDPNQRDVLRRIIHRAEVEPKLKGKIVVPAALLARPGFALAEGNHNAFLDGAPVPATRLAGLDLAHFPIRSAEQYLSSVIVTRIAWISRTDYNPQWSQHIREFYGELKNKPNVTTADLVKAACCYIAPYSENGPPRSITFAERPLRPGYGALRYADLTQVKVLPRLMGLAEALVRQLEAARQRAV